MTRDFTEPTRMLDARMFGLTVDRLCIEFGPNAARQQVETLVRDCLTDLAGSPVGALPELCERLARQRLSEGIDAIALQRHVYGW